MNGLHYPYGSSPAATVERAFRARDIGIPIRLLAPIRYAMLSAGGDPHDVVEIRGFCRAQSDEALLRLRNFGPTALGVVRAWSGQPEEIIANWVGEADPNAAADRPAPCPRPAAPPPVLRYATRLHSLREASGLDVRQLARAAGLAVGAVAQTERLRQRASPSTLVKLAAALGVEPGELVGEANRGE